MLGITHTCFQRYAFLSTKNNALSYVSFVDEMHKVKKKGKGSNQNFQLSHLLHTIR